MDFINSSCGRCLSAFFQDRAPPEKGQKFWFHPADISQTCSQVGHVCREMQPHRGPLLAGAGHTLRGGQHPAALSWRGLAVCGGWAHQQAGKDHARRLGRRRHGAAGSYPHHCCGMAMRLLLRLWHPSERLPLRCPLQAGSPGLCRLLLLLGPGPNRWPSLPLQCH